MKPRWPLLTLLALGALAAVVHDGGAPAVAPASPVDGAAMSRATPPVPVRSAARSRSADPSAPARLRGFLRFPGGPT